MSEYFKEHNNYVYRAAGVLLTQRCINCILAELQIHIQLSLFNSLGGMPRRVSFSPSSQMLLQLFS